MADENKKVDGQENEDKQEQQPEKKGGAMKIVKKVFTIGEKVVMGGLTALGAYALYKAVKPEPKSNSTSDSNE